MEWAIEECKKTTLPVAASMCIGPEGDMHGVSAAECAVRMARAGADIGSDVVEEERRVCNSDFDDLIFQLESIVTMIHSCLWSV